MVQDARLSHKRIARINFHKDSKSTILDLHPLLFFMLAMVITASCDGVQIRRVHFFNVSQSGFNSCHSQYRYNGIDSHRFRTPLHSVQPCKRRHFICRNARHMSNEHMQVSRGTSFYVQEVCLLLSETLILALKCLSAE